MDYFLNLVVGLGAVLSVGFAAILGLLLFLSEPAVGIILTITVISYFVGKKIRSKYELEKERERNTK